jgi:hypothetical protein
MPTFDPGVLDALSAPLGELIASVGRGVADAQREMDLASIAAFLDVYERSEGLFLELQRIGYRPNWYHIPEAEGDIQVALTISGQQTRGPSAGTAPPLKIYAAPVDAGYASRFGFTVQAASRVKFRIVPVPPSSAAEAVQVMPALEGLTRAEARARLAMLGIEAEVPDGPDSALVSGQQPAPGSVLAAGAPVRIEIDTA